MSRWDLRLATVRDLVAALAAARADRAELRRRCELTKGRLDQMLDEEAEASFPLWALDHVLDLVGVEFLSPHVEARGFRLVPKVDVPPERHDVIAQAAKAMREAGDAIEKTLAALPDGITPSEAAMVDREIDEAVRELLSLKADVRAAVVTPS